MTASCARSGIRELKKDDMATNGSFYWNELMTRDAEAAKKFYGATLGWTFEPMEQDGGPAYWLAKVGEESVAGIYSIDANDQETSEGWFAYVAVDDLSGALARASMEGGEVLREPWMCRASAASRSSTTMPATRWAG